METSASNPAYSARQVRRLCAGQTNGPARLLIVFGACVALAGCSYQLDSLFGKDDPAHTGSIAGASAPAADASPERDLILAKEAAIELLNGDDKAASIAWENPSSRAHGSVTRVSEPYSAGGFPCQDFLTSYVRRSQESWMRGSACRVHQGRWEIRDLKPGS